MPSFERGFKIWAERTALALRKDLELGPGDALVPKELAEHLGITVWTPKDVPGLPLEIIKQLIEKDPWAWSAVSLQVDGQGLIIYNPKKSKPRQASDITHETAHFILDHQPATVVLSQEVEVAMRTFDKKQEDEANWLAWCLLAPREGLVRCSLQRLSPEAIADQFGVSVQLVNFRISMTGINAQLKRAIRK